ncbi:hypothetical protein AB0G04_41610 [Actinoplanes sp. NPDC023801]|uniref:hypothetical protein n=1 Tax=Actinoplanes sp. NPDC023801 TaxID=3154595 RepID=UPI0033D497DE
MRLRPLAAALAALILTACAPPDAAGPSIPAPSRPGAAPELPSGWRWESYGGVQVGVPGEWGWDDRALRLDAWCIEQDSERRPVVARPGAPVPAIGCPDGGNLIKNTGWVVGFGQALPGEPDGVLHSGDRATVRTAGVEVIVQVPRDIRDRIAATVHRVDVDAYGCPATHPISSTRAWRPPAGPDIAALHDVTSLSACRYGLGSPASLISSLRLDGPAARRALQGITRAPAGGGPDRPQDCAPEVAWGDEAIVLRVRSAAGLTEITVRYASCSGHGFDDGGTVRGLTLAAIAPFTSGANTVPALEAQLAEALSPRPDASR